METKSCCKNTKNRSLVLERGIPYRDREEVKQTPLVFLVLERLKKRHVLWCYIKLPCLSENAVTNAVPWRNQLLPKSNPWFRLVCQRTSLDCTFHLPIFVGVLLDLHIALKSQKFKICSVLMMSPERGKHWSSDAIRLAHRDASNV